MSTDDTYVEADTVGISTDVPGIVEEVDVTNNQHVEPGQVLYRLDPQQFQIALDNAKASLSQTVTQFWNPLTAAGRADMTTKRTSNCRPAMSAFGGKADMAVSERCHQRTFEKRHRLTQAARMQWPPAVIWNCKIHVRSCKSAPSAVDLFAGSDILAAQQDNVGRYDVMKGSKTIYNEMVDIISRYATDDGEHTTSIDGLIFGRRTSPTQLLHTSAQPCFALVLQGEKSLTLGDEVYRYGLGDYLVISIELPVLSQVTRASKTTPLLGFGMAINPDRLKQVMGSASLVRSAIPPDEIRGVAVNKAAPELLDASLRLLKLLDAPQDIPVLAPLIEGEILYRLLIGPFGPRLRQIAITETPTNRIAAAVAWLKKNFMHPLRIEKLADRVGMSVSALHHQFKAVTAMTPMQYQKQLRLHEARRLMLVELLDVGSAGYAVGYQSPSQFSREYTRLYGKSPLRDVGGLRLAPAGASTNLPQKLTQLAESGGPTREHSLRS